MIDKEVFIKFLKDNDFYEKYIEGFYLDNSIYGDLTSLDEFLEECEPEYWMYSGLSGFSLNLNWLDNEKIKDTKIHFYNWRKKNISKWRELDKKWTRIVNNY